jgi:hypothetical protein
MASAKVRRSGFKQMLRRKDFFMTFVLFVVHAERCLV